MPRRHTVANFTGVRFDSLFTLKQMLNSRYALQAICMLWTLFLFLTAYWLRALESTACQFSTATHAGCQSENARVWLVHQSVGVFHKHNDPYLWNAVWATFGTSTTVGYGDMHATTAAGRGISIIVSFGGLAGLALLTSSFMNSMAYTPQEFAASLMIDRARAESTLMFRAASFLQAWFRFRCQLMKTASQDRGLQAAGKLHKWASCRYVLYLARTAFREARTTAVTDPADLLADQVKIDSIAVRSRDVVEAVTNLHSSLFCKLPSHRTSLLPQSVLSGDRLHHTRVGRSEKAGAANGQDNLTTDIQRERMSDLERVVARAYIKKYARRSERQPLNRMFHVANLAVPGNNKGRRWRFKREAVENRLIYLNFCAAVFGLCGTASAIFQFEAIFIYDYDPSSMPVNAAKIVASATSLICLFFIYRIYWTNLLAARLWVLAVQVC